MKIKYNKENKEWHRRLITQWQPFQSTRRRYEAGVELTNAQTWRKYQQEILTLPNFEFLWDPLESTCRHASLSIL